MLSVKCFGTLFYVWMLCSVFTSCIPEGIQLPNIYSVTTTDVTNITSDGVTLNGSLGIINTEKAIVCGVEYGTQPTSLSSKQPMDEITSDGDFSVNITGLNANTTYYYRAYAVDAGGTYKYGDLSFFNINGGDYRIVDLGLSVKWAACNVGAVAPEEHGAYYAWGETTEKTNYDWTTYKWCKGEWDTMTKYCTDRDYGTVDNKTSLEINDDAAHKLWGGNWRMPTFDEIKELYTKCTWRWTTCNGVKGYIITGTNGNSIFLPAVGRFCDSSVIQYDYACWYWSSTLDRDYPYDSHCLMLFDGKLSWGTSDYPSTSHYRDEGYPIRPVYDIPVSVKTGDASDITDSGATLSGTVCYSDKSVTCGIIYGTSSTLSSTSGTKKSTNSSGSYSVTISGLKAKTTYYYRAYAIVDGEYKYGDVRSFTTEADISITVGEAVDLGLSVKWASWNVGATAPEEYGGYYAWGETEEKTEYSWSTYKWCNGSEYSLTKYCTDNYYGTIDNKSTLEPEDDVAHVKWGDSWRMPTFDEIMELLDECSWQWTAVNGVNGQKVTGPNGNSIFLPAAGYYASTMIYERGSEGLYNSSMLAENSFLCYSCRGLVFDESRWYWYGHSGYQLGRHIGFSVRPVYGASKSKVSVTTGDATDITDCGATLSGIVGNSDKSVACGIIYGTSSTLSSTNGTLVSTTSSGEFSIDVTGFSPNTTYYYCAYVVVEGEYTYGEVRSFTTYSFATVTSGDAIDLGLSVKWASCNVGAESPEVYGNYFAWGETEPKSSYGESNSITHGMSLSELESRGFIDANGNLSAAYDAAAVNWGGNWRMPTLDEIQELIDDCVWEWSWMYGINGYKVTGPNGNSIFFPTAGFRSGMSLYDVGIICSYWSAMPCINGDFSYVLYFNSGSYAQSYDARCRGFTVRPVYDSKENNSDVDLDGYPKDEDWEVRRRK